MSSPRSASRPTSRGGFLCSGCRALLRSRGSCRSRPVILVYAGWLTLSVLTPFYHPYARLWLPLAGVRLGVPGRRDRRAALGGRGRWREAARSNLRSSPAGSRSVGSSRAFAFHALRCVAPSFHGSSLPASSAEQRAARLARAERLAEDGLPRRSQRSSQETSRHLRVFARPPVTFYLGQLAGVAIERQPSLERLAEAGRRRNLGVARHGDHPAR